ncbi:MAG: prepilin-type N-terminal cleavage/methylation domain-containing protein, partial [Cetobacterium sp.]
MYINKNKGMSIVEILITLLVLSILFEIFYVYIISINLQKKEMLKKLEIKLNVN